MLILAVGLSLSPFLLNGQAGAEEKPADWLQKGDENRKTGHYEAARDCYLKALSHYESTAQFYELSHLYAYLAEVELQLNDIKNAIQAADQAYALIHRHFDPDTVRHYAITLINKGVCAGKQGRYEQQMAFYRAGQQNAIETYGFYSKVASDAYNNIGVAFGRRGSWQTCLAYIDTALAISKKIQDQESVFATHNNKANAYAEIGDLERAIWEQRQALEAALRPAQQAQAKNNLGSLLVEAGEFEAGLQQLDEAAQMRRPADGRLTEEYLSTRLNQIWAYSEEGNRAEREALLRRLLQQIKAQSPVFDHSSYYQIAYNYQARDLLMVGDLYAAYQSVRAAERVASGVRTTEASTQLVKAMVLRRLGAYEEGLRAVHASYALLVPSFRPQALADYPDWRELESIGYTLTLFPLQAALLEEWGQSCQQADWAAGALRVLEAADSAVTASRLSFQSQASKDMMAENARTLYQSLIDLHYRLYADSGALEHANKAFYYMEKNKALSVLENLNALEAATFHDIPEPIVERERRLREDLEFYKLELKYCPDCPESLRRQWEKQLYRIQEEQDSLQRVIREDFPRYYRTRIELSVRGLETVRRRVLYPEETLLVYFQAEPWLYVLVADKTRTHLLRLPAEDLQEPVLALHKALRNKQKEAFALSHRLFQLVLQPVLPAVHHPKLVVVPDGVLSYIPFDQLQTKAGAPGTGRFLIEDYSIRRLLSGSTALQYQGLRRVVEGQEGVLAIAPTFQSDSQSVDAPARYGQLPGAQQEVTVLQSLFGGAFLTGGAATESAFKGNCSRAAILHLATHTDINDQFPNASHLLLKASGEEDGRLNVYEIYGQAMPAQLGFLSGCNTGIGRLRPGEGAISLGHAFAYAGCPNIVMTLWPIKDNTAPDLVGVFYRNLKQGLNKAEALRQAKLHCLRYDDLFAHPYYWSGFTYTGDREKVLTKTKASSGWMLLALLLGAGGLLLLLLRRRQRQASAG